MRVQRVLPLVVSSLLVATPLLAGSKPVTVSPGDPSKLVLIGDTCPTFSWGQVDKAQGYELLVYHLGEDGEEAMPVLRQRISGSALTWTPALSRCLERGGRYAWTVRALGGREASEWSTPALFQVAAPTAEQFEEALEVVRAYLALQAGDGPQATATAKAETEVGPGSELATADSPSARAAAPTELFVSQGVEAASFKGDGSELTALTPENLSAGVGGIDISGNAATATTATTADDLACTDCVSESELDFDPSTQTELDTHTGSADAHREHATLEESAEIDADIGVHAALANVHHTPTVDTDTVLTEAQVETFVTNEPLDGSNFTNLNGNSVTTGTVAEARIADEITRDSELLPGGGPGVLRLLQCATVGWRYWDLGDGTVWDCNTGLVWLKDATCLGTGTWSPVTAGGSVQKKVADLNGGTDFGCTDYVAGSYTDWRVPEVSALCSAGAIVQTCPADNAPDSLINSSVSGSPKIVNAEGNEAWSEGDAFVGVSSAGDSYYWSDTSGGAGAFYVFLYNGSVSTSLASAPANVWPVRGGQ